MKDQSGQSLIQILISVAIMGVVITAMSSMFNSLNHETRAMSEKLAAMDLEKVLIAGLADGSGCLYALTHPAPLVFDANSAMSEASPLVIPLPASSSAPARLYSSYDPALPTPLGTVLAQVGERAAPYSNSLIVSGISFELTSISGPKVNGRLRVDFDGAKTVRAVKPAYVSLTLQADVSNPGSAKFTSCQTAALAGSSGSGDWCGAFLAQNSNGVFSIKEVIMPCHGTVPGCPSGTTEAAAPWKGPNGSGIFCKNGPFFYGYDVNTVCPSGFSPKQVMTALKAYAPAVTDPESGSVITPGVEETNTLLTCTPN